MAERDVAYVRFLNADRRNPGWWHLNAGGDLTRCGLRLGAAKASQFVEFAGRVDWEEVCTRCRPVH